MGLQKTRKRNNTAELYFSSHNNIARWLGRDVGRTANTLAKSDGPKVSVRPFYRKFRSGSSETIHYVQRALYFFFLNSIIPKYCRASENPKHMFKLYCPSHNNIARWLGADLGRTANTPAKSDGPKINRPYPSPSS